MQSALLLFSSCTVLSLVRGSTLPGSAGTPPSTPAAISRDALLQFLTLTPKETAFGTQTSDKEVMCNGKLPSIRGNIYSHGKKKDLDHFGILSAAKVLLTGESLYEPGMNCTIVVQAPAPDFSFMVTFPSAVSLAARISNFTDDSKDVNLCYDSLWVGFEESLADGTVVSIPVFVYCDREYPLSNLSAFEVNSDRLKVRFRTAPDSRCSIGFQLIYYVFRSVPSSGVCNEQQGDWLCDVNIRPNYPGRCIPKPFVCDGVYHCIDKTDETGLVLDCGYTDRLFGKLANLGVYGAISTVIAIILVASCICGCLCAVCIFICKKQSKKSREKKYDRYAAAINHLGNRSHDQRSRKSTRRGRQ